MPLTLMDIDVLVVGLIAAVYANATDEAPQRHWGYDAIREPIRVGNDRYAAGREVRDGLVGVRLRVDRGYYGGEEKSSEDYWIPTRDLAHTTVTFGA
jgi:hypothetical protein